MANYKKPRGRSRASRMRQTLGQMDDADQRDSNAVTMQSSEVVARARIQERFPDETPEEIEKRVALVMEGGAEPTTARVLQPGSIPPEVLAARAADRKKRKLLNRGVRRFGVALKRLLRELPPWSPKGDRS